MNSTERGAVALITAMIVSILLMITTAGMVSLTLRSLRQSTDGAQSTKAYYAAESGLEAALLNLSRDPNYKGDCSPGTTTKDSAKSGAVTCINVRQSTGAATGHVDLNETDQIDLSAMDNVGTITVDWSKGGKVDKIPNYSGGFPGANSVNKWDSSAPAVLEVGVIEYPDPVSTPTFTIDKVQYFQGVVAPASSKSTDPSGGIKPDLSGYSYTASNAQSKANRAYVGRCIQSNEYQCQITVGNFNVVNGRKRYVLRIKSRYNATDYRITVRNSSGAVVTIPNSMYIIDVTARAGDVFRRAQTSFSTLPESISGLDYVLYSDTDICKAYEIKGGTASGLNSCSAP